MNRLKLASDQAMYAPIEVHLDDQHSFIGNVSTAFFEDRPDDPGGVGDVQIEGELHAIHGNDMHTTSYEQLSPMDRQKVDNWVKQNFHKLDFKNDEEEYDPENSLSEDYLKNT